MTTKPSLSFRDWSAQAETNPTIWPPQPEWPPASISILMKPARFVSYPVSIEVGEPHTSIDLDRAVIRHPEPFDTHGLTDACRQFLFDAVSQAVDHDHHLRWINWSDAEPTSCNPINGHRQPYRKPRPTRFSPPSRDHGEAA